MNQARVRLALMLGLVTALAPAAAGQWESQAGGTKARLRGLSVVDGRVAWASGTGGTVVRTVDGGATWKARTVPGAGGLDLRDVQAFDARAAVVLSIGEGEQSRVYKTTDGGETWSLLHTNRDPKGFLDALAFSDPEHGLILGDPVDGRFVLLRTEGGGKSWERVAPEGMPPALTGEGAFAASGTCLVVHGDRHAWFGTGGAKAARVFRSDDQGKTWTAHETPFDAADPAAGVFSLAFRDERHGVVVGGDYKHPERSGRVAARTDDGGRTWTLAERLPGGYRSAVAYLPGAEGPTLVAVGPTGSDLSADEGRTWLPLGKMGFHAVGFARGEAGWAVGDDGAIAKFTGRPAAR